MAYQCATMLPCNIIVWYSYDIQNMNHSSTRQVWTLDHLNTQHANYLEPHSWFVISI